MWTGLNAMLEESNQPEPTLLKKGGGKVRKFAQLRARKKEYLFLAEAFAPPAPKPDRSPVVFVRASNYMKYAQTRREMVFYDHKGREIQVRHAFPVRRNSLDFFRKKFEWGDLRYEEVLPEPGERIYSLRWKEVNAFVAESGETLNPFLWYSSNEPPQLFKFHPRHAAAIDLVYHPCPHGCFYDCGEDRLEVGIEIRYQVVFSPVPLAFIRGRDTQSMKRVEESSILPPEGSGN